jgi:hypothetical protein
MKSFSLPRLTLCLWFGIYTLFCLFSYLMGSVRHEIMLYIVWASIFTGLCIMVLGFIEDKA